MRADFELSYSDLDGWRLNHFYYPDNPAQRIPVQGFPNSRRRHREARTLAESAILARTGTTVSGWEQDQDGAANTYWFAHLDG